MFHCSAAAVENQLLVSVFVPGKQAQLVGRSAIGRLIEQYCQSISENK